jgi:predicted nucleic acid-binding protein
MAAGLLDTSVVIDWDDPTVAAAVLDAGRSHRRRFAHLLIAATAHANRLPLYTRNPDDFAGLDALIEVIGI